MVGGVRLTRKPARPRSSVERNPHGRTGYFAMSLARAAACEGEQWWGHAPEEHPWHSVESQVVSFVMITFMVRARLD